MPAARHLTPPEGAAWKRQTWSWRRRNGEVYPYSPHAEVEFGPQHGRNTLGIPKLECAMVWLTSAKPGNS